MRHDAELDAVQGDSIVCELVFVEDEFVEEEDRVWEKEEGGGEGCAEGFR